MSHDETSDCLRGSDFFDFGPFRLVPNQRLLMLNGQALQISGRALEILTMLVECPGEIISKVAIYERIWPGLFVDESNLRVHIAALRKALGDSKEGYRYILNTPNRGYSFAASVSRGISEAPAKVASHRAEPPHNVPALLTRVIGRDEVVASLCAQITRRRFLSLIGPGGIGKTTVAQAVAARTLQHFGNRVYFIDLAPLSDADLVLARLAVTLGVSPIASDQMAEIVTFLGDQSTLLVLDNCEHIVDYVAGLIERVLRGAPSVTVLATSREPLRAEGEYTVPLKPLNFPVSPHKMDVSELLSYPSVELFIERAGGFDTTTLSDEEMLALAEICRRLDGIPLAIELAARRVDIFGLRALAVKLDDRFSLLTRGRRTALPRHQTLRATLDWSHDLLSPREQMILRRLSIFTARFTVEAAQDVVAAGDVGLADIGEDMASLIAKSLVVPELGEGSAHYKLLETTWAYAREKLIESGEKDHIARSHALYYNREFIRSEADREHVPVDNWLIRYGPKMDNMRSALEWAFSPKGDADIAISLTVAAAPLWLQFSVMNECRKWVEAAICLVEAGADIEKGSRMRLYAALGWPQMYAKGPGVKSGAAAWRTALEIANDLEDRDFQLRALWALWADRINHGECRVAYGIAKQFCLLAEDVHDQLVGKRITGASLHFMGDLAGARQNIDDMLAQYTPTLQARDIIRFQFDQVVTARITRARTLWLQGLAEQAFAEIALAIDRAQSIDHVFSHLNVLAQAACPVALLAGDLAAAEQFTATLRKHTKSHGMGIWDAYANCFDGEVLIRQGQTAAGLEMLGGGIAELRDASFVQYITAYLAALAKGYANARKPTEGMVAINEAIARCERNDEHWCFAELLRIKADLTLLEGGTGALQEAETTYQKSLQTARKQQALSWELRTATSLAACWQNQNRIVEARALLAPIYAQFDEGFNTEDLMDAARLLNQLKEGGVA